VIGLDCLDNTPLIDIKPYFASTIPCRMRWSVGHASRDRGSRG